MKKKLLAAACSFDMNTSSEYLVIIPEGEFRGLDGRPFDAPAWLLTPARGREIVAVLNQRNIDMVIDYEHATLKMQDTGEPAPAAGWLKPAGFYYIEGVGICNSQFEWTDKAKSFIASNEYKYLSPVFGYSTTGEVLCLINAALTNTPNLDELPEAKLAAAAQNFLSQNLEQDSEMNEELLERLRWMLNLPVSATAEDIITELNKLAAQMSEKTGVTVAENSQNLYDALNAIELKIAANSQAVPDPALYVPMDVYREAVENGNIALANAKVKEVEDLIVAACSDGRLTGDATVKWVRDQAKTNPDFVKKHLESLPKIAALTQKQTQTINLTANNQQQTPPRDEIAESIAAQFGLPTGI